MKRNLAFNGGAAAAKVRPQQGDARIVMMQNAGVRPACRMSCSTTHSLISVPGTAM